MIKDLFDSIPSGMVRTKRGRIKPASNPTLSNLRKKSSVLESENKELKDRLSQLEDAVASLVGKKKVKLNGN
jgi:hypothetical protein